MNSKGIEIRPNGVKITRGNGISGLKQYYVEGNPTGFDFLWCARKFADNTENTSKTVK